MSKNWSENTIGKQTQLDSIFKRLQKYPEKKLRNIIQNFFYDMGFAPRLTHNPGEHGADIVMELKDDEDPLGRVQFYFFQVKKGEITLPNWHRDVCGQLTELYCRPPMVPNAQETFPRRIVLITSGLLTPEVDNAISNWNRTLPIPIEVFNGPALAKLLFRKGYTLEKITKLSKPLVKKLGKTNFGETFLL